MNFLRQYNFGHRLDGDHRNLFIIIFEIPMSVFLKIIIPVVIYKKACFSQSVQMWEAMCEAVSWNRIGAGHFQMLH